MELATIQTPPLVSTLETRLEKLKAHFEKIKNSTNDAELATGYDAFLKTLKDFQSQRMPLTRKFDEIKSLFTGLESEIQKCIDVVKARRNELAKIAYEAKQAEERKARAEMEAKQKAIELEAQKRIELKEFVLNLILQKKELVVKGLASVTSENYAKKLEGLQKFPTALDIKDVPNMIEDLKEELSELYQKDMEDFKQEALNEIQFMKDMPLDQKKEYVRQFQQSIRGEKETALEIEQHKESIEKEVKQTEVILDSIPSGEDVKTPNMIEIEVTNKAAYKSLVAYWFEIIFPTYEKEIGTKTVNSMILDLQRHAKQTGQRLNVSGVKYNEVFSVR